MLRGLRDLGARGVERSAGVVAVTVTWPAKRRSAWPSASSTSRSRTSWRRRRWRAVSRKPCFSRVTWSPSSRVMSFSAWRWARLGAIGSATTDIARWALVRFRSGARKRQPTSRSGQRWIQNVACQAESVRIESQRSSTANGPAASGAHPSSPPAAAIRARWGRAAGSTPWRIAIASSLGVSAPTAPIAGIGERLGDEAQLVDDDRPPPRGRDDPAAALSLTDLTATAAQRRSAPRRSTRGRAPPRRTSRSARRRRAPRRHRAGTARSRSDAK